MILKQKKSNMKYTLKQVTEAVNNWSKTKLTEAEINYFLKSLEDVPPFKHDLKSKTIMLSENEIANNKTQLKKWTDKDWILLKTIEFE